MRRTLAMVVGASLAVTLAGATAYARSVSSSAPETAATRAAASVAPPSVADPAAATAAAPADRAAAAPAPAGKARAQASRTESAVGTSTAVGRQTVGALENVGALLGYLDEGTSRTFDYPGANYVKVHFDRLAMLPGDYVTVTDASGAEVHRIESDPLTAVGGLLGSRADGNGRWAMSVEGDTAVVTLHRARPSLLAGVERLAGLGVSVDRVARGFTPAERAAREAERKAAAGPGREESVCGGDESEDAVCYKSADPVAYTRSKAVARLLINGTELCTGWRIGANNRMMTNNHCMVTSADAYDTEVWFNYQCAQCGGHAVFRSTKVWGDRVLSTDRDLDYTLFSVEDFDRIKKFGYLSIDTARPAKGSQVYIPQHPGGDPTRIAMDSDRDRAGNCAVEDPLYDGYAKDSDVSYYCDTAGGSSGSPVLSRATDKVIAIHHFGGCPNSGVRIDLINNRIKKLL